MADNVTTAKFTVDISDLKKNIQEANRQVKLANAEFKSATAGMDKWSKSADGLSAKISQLQKNLSSQKTILSEYQKQLKLIEDQYGKDSKQADEMRIKIYNQEAVVKNTEAALGKYEKQLEEVEKETKKAGSAYEELDKKIKDQEKALEEAKKEYASIVLEQGKSSEAAKDLAKDIEKLSKELEQDKKAFDEAGNAADKLAGDLDDTGKQASIAGAAADKASGGFTVMKGVLADLAATAIKAVVQGLKDLAAATADAWKSFDEGRDTIIKLTGASGDLKDSLLGSYSNVSKTILADSADIGNAIGEVNTRFDITGTQLDKISEKYLKFAQITDSDVIGSIDDTQKALSAYGKGVESIPGFLDTLAATSQKTGVQTSTLTSGIISNATAFQEMGLSLDQAVVFMGQLEKSGTNSETVLNGMRKALKNSTKDGKDMNQALMDLQNQIEGNTKGTKGLQAAYDLFGKSGDQIYGAIKNGTLSFKDLTSVLDDTSGAVDKTYASTLDATDKMNLKFQEMKFTLAEAFDGFLQENSPMLEKAIDDIGGALVSVIPTIKSALDELLPYITEFIKNDLPVLIENIKKELPGIIENIIKKIPDIVAAIEKAIPVVMELIDFVVEHKDAIIKGLEAIVALLTTSKIITAVSTITKAVKGLGTVFEGAEVAVGALGTAFGTFAAGVGAFFAGAEVGKKLGEWLFPDDAELYEHYEGISGTFELIKDTYVTIGEEIMYSLEDQIQAFKDGWENIKQFAIDAWDGISRAWGMVCDWFNTNVIEPVVQFFTDAWNNISQFATDAWTAISGAWQTASEWFNTSVIQPVVQFFTEAWENIKQFATDAWDAITGAWEAASEWFSSTVIEPITSFFTEMWENVKQFASDAWDGICELFGDAVDWFTDIFQGVSDAIEKIFKGIVEVVKKPINTLIGLLNKFIDDVNGIEIPDWVPGVGGKSINIKHINELERGGILRKGQTGFLEGNGAEAVVPLDQNQKWVASITKELKRQLQTSSASGGSGRTISGGDTIYNFNQTNNSPKALSRLDIYRQTKNQLAYANGGGLVHA